MKKKIVYILTILMLILINVFMLTNFAFADNYNISAFESGTVPSSIDKLTSNTLETAIATVRTVGTGIALVIIAVIAMKYMMASPSDRADIKKHAVPFVIGACVLFAASNFITIIAKFASII